ncbi:MAG: hypothetical protein ABIL09_05690 [Gemmatimonadota bacterium]
MLSWIDLLGSLARLGALSFRLALHRKLPFMLGAVAAYYAGLYAFALVRPGEGFGAGEALYALVEVPGAVLAVYLAMDLVARERDRNTLEILYTTASSHYRIWLMRLLAADAVLAVLLLAMSATAYYGFAEFPWVAGWLNALPPTFLAANLTFYLSVRWRSGNAAGMVALGALVAVLLTAGQLQQSPWFLYIKPFAPPMGIDAAAWLETGLANRAAVLAAGSLLLYLGLRRLGDRERLLS